MAFQLSPGVNVSEIDLTTIVPSVSTSSAAFAGNFDWGPVDEVVTVSNELKLVEYFGKPSANNYEGWYTAANFLAYSNNLKVVRVANTGHRNAITNTSASVGNTLFIKNETDYNQNFANNGSYLERYGEYAAKYAGSLGNSLAISICPNANAYSMNVATVTANAFLSAAYYAGNTVLTLPGSANVGNYIKAGDLIALADGTVTTSYVAVSNISGTTITLESPGLDIAVSANSSILRRWKYYSEFSDSPGTSTYASARAGSNDELHVVVYDAGGVITGTKNSIIEKYGFVSKGSDAKNSDGSTNYYKDVLNNRSRYIWHLQHPAIANTVANTGWGSPVSNQTFTEDTGYAYNSYLTFGTGSDFATVTDGELILGYDKFGNADEIDISLVLTGSASATVTTSVISMVESRKDCVVFISPRKSDVVDNYGSELTKTIEFRNSLTSTSYGVMDSGWKYQYDKYNDTYRWVPLNGDIAGLAARTDRDRDPWFSPAGLNRGIIKNVIRLAWNPDKASRDELYQKGINPVVTFPGEGTILYGDKTLLSRPSAFDRINVRRLFIVIEKAIARAARSSLFEFNDQFTRAQFVALIEPYLRDVQGRRGIFDFRVVCDETNNTPEIIDRNEFVGDIYIKPARSINFIQLNFVAVRTGVAFEEVVGQF
jgi:phage tail sheath protein FI